MGLDTLVPSVDDGSAMAKHEPPDLLPGTLDLLILTTLARGEMHGYGIAQL